MQKSSLPRLFTRKNRRAADPVRRAAIEALESRQLLTVVPVSGFTAPAATGATGTSATVELTRYVDDNTLTTHTVRLTLPTGSVDVQTFDSEVPNNVANFLRYVRGGSDGRGYNDTIFQRFVQNFVMQGATFYTDGTQISHTGQPVVTDEVAAGAGRHNTRGTLAFARSNGDANSADSAFFINVADNSSNLDNQAGGFDVFGQIIAGASGGAAVADPVTLIDQMAGFVPRERVLSDAVLVLPNVTFHAVSDNPAVVSVVDPATTEGKLQLNYLGAVGSSATITVTATQPGQTTPVTMQFTATVAAAPFTAAFGGATGVSSVIYKDADGTSSTITYKGAGTGTIQFTGTSLAQATARGKITVTGTSVAADKISLTGSAATDTLTISNRGGNKRTAVSEISIANSLKSVIAPNTDVTHSFNAAAGLATLTLANVSDALVEVTGGTGAPLPVMNFGDATNIELNTGIAIKSVKFTSVANTDGDLPAFVSAPSIGSLTITKAYSGNVNTNQGIGIFKVGGDLTAAVTASTIGTLTVGGSLSSSSVTLSQAFAAGALSLRTAKIGKAIDHSYFQTVGNIGTVTAKSMNVGGVFAGVPDVAVVTVATDFLNAATIQSIKIPGAIVTPFISAPNIGKTTLGAVTLDNSGSADGISALKITALTFRAGGKNLAFKNLDTQTQFDTQFTAKAGSLSLADFKVTLL